jgi:hypothetical protein
VLFFYFVPDTTRDLFDVKNILWKRGALSDENKQNNLKLYCGTLAKIVVLHHQDVGSEKSVYI